jgi:protein SCO1
MRRHLRLLVLPVALGAAAGLAAALVHQSGGAASSGRPQTIRAQIRWGAGVKLAPVFALRDQNGTRLSLAAFHGRPVVLTFLDSVCKRACPLEGRVLTDVERHARRTGMVLAVVGVDPWSETPRTVRRFTRKLHWTGRWYWFLGTRHTLLPVWNAYHIAVRRIPGDVAHSVALYVIDPSGHLRAGYLFPFSAADVAHDVQSVTTKHSGQS